MAQLVIAIIVLFFVTFATDVITSEQNPNAKYVGVSRCGSSGCHGSPKLGDQMSAWEESAHATATIALESKKAKKFASKLNIVDPASSELCISCHVTAYDVPDDRLAHTFIGDEGIECEVCHGPGSRYLKPHQKKDRKTADLVAQGMRSLQTEKEIRDTCAQCHGNADMRAKLKPSGHPKLDKLSFEEAMKKIKHWKDKD